MTLENQGEAHGEEQGTQPGIGLDQAALSQPAGDAPGDGGAGSDAAGAGTDGAGADDAGAGADEEGLDVEGVDVEHNGETFRVPKDLLDEHGEIDAEKAAKRAVDLRRKLSEKGQAAPDEYTLTVPDEFKDKWTVDADDPLFTSMVPMMKEAGISQEQFDKLYAGYVAAQAQAVEQQAEANRDGFEKLSERFGDVSKASEFFTKTYSPWIANVLTGDDALRVAKFEALHSLVGASSHGALALLDIFDSVRKPGIEPAQGGQTQPRLTQADLDKLQASDAYMDPMHPEHQEVQKRVREGYQMLYPQ